jgi:hypothetical protein
VAHVTLEAVVNATGVDGRGLNVEDQLDAAYVRARSSVTEPVVPTMATQSSASGHERLLSALTDEGICEGTLMVVQAVPPLVV